MRFLAGPGSGPNARRCSAPPKRTMVLLGNSPSRELIEAADEGRAPRADYVDLARALDADLVSHEGRLIPPLAALAGRAPLLASSLAAFLEQRRYNAIYVTGEDLGLRLAPLLRLSGWEGRLVVVVHACVSARRRLLLRTFADTFSALICVSEAQQQILVRGVGLPPEKVHVVRDWVDADFFAPSTWPPPEPDEPFAFACGLEQRDYPTLLAAATLSPHAVRIAASGYHGVSAAPAQPPRNVRFQWRRIPYPDLRRAYETCRLVVLPLHRAEYAAGVSGLLEAMAMGKPVVATASRGLAEYLRGGACGRIVPAGDASAMAAAIDELWEAPEERLEIGLGNRAWVKANASLPTYIRRAANLVRPPG